MWSAKGQRGEKQLVPGTSHGWEEGPGGSAEGDARQPACEWLKRAQIRITLYVQRRGDRSQQVRGKSQIRSPDAHLGVCGFWGPERDDATIASPASCELWQGRSRWPGLQGLK